MIEVVVGVALTAVLGGRLVPLVKQRVERQSERRAGELQLVDTLAAELWTYWKQALRVAYYGARGNQFADQYEVALDRWDGDRSWEIGTKIQIEVSRSKRLLDDRATRWLDEAQLHAVTQLDERVDRLRHSGTPDDWLQFQDDLLGDLRSEIDDILTGVVRELNLNR